MNFSPHSESAKEERLIARGDIKQWGRDIDDFHIRADDPLATAGSVIMAPAVAITKIGNAIAGEFSTEQAEPLKGGGIKYISRDVRSAGKNILAAGKNLLTLHPLRAAGNVLKAGFDGLDIVFVDPLLDIGSGISGHQNRARSSIQKTLAT